MLSKEEIKKWILENCRDKEGKIDLSGLDFSDVKVDVDISYMRVNGNLTQKWQTVKGDIDQSNQLVYGSIYQGNSRALDSIFQSNQACDFQIYQTDQWCAGIIYSGIRNMEILKEEIENRDNLLRYLHDEFDRFDKITVEEFCNTEKHIAVHCNTKEKFDKFINKVNEVTDSDRGYDTWEECYGEDTCISTGMVFGEEKIFKKLNYKIVEFEDLEDFK